MSELKGDCQDCHRPMRASRRTITQFPGTVPYHGQGVCSTCYRRRKGTNGTRSKKPTTDMDVTATKRSLMAYHQWRKPFREKAGISSDGN
jgi:hypothetical protein